MERLPVIKAPLYTPSLEEVANGNHWLFTNGLTKRRRDRQLDNS